MKKLIITIVCLLSALCTVRAQEVIRIGIIGLDTSHSTAFTELLNGTSDDPLAREFEVVAAYPYGSTSIPTSRDRIPGYIETVKKFGVEMPIAEAVYRVLYKGERPQELIKELFARPLKPEMRL